MKILVTGGVGFIGMNLIKELLKDGHNIHSLDNYDSGTKENEHKGVTYHYGDIEMVTLMDSDFDLIYHLAALSRIQPSFTDPTETFRVNTIGTQRVLDFAKSNNIKVIYAGSSSRWHNPLLSPYACFKYLGEEVVKLYKSVYSINAEIVRFYNVYGPNEIVDGDWAAVIGIWRRQVRDGLPITIVGDGNQRRDFTHVYDIVDGLIRVGYSEQTHEDGWELGTGVNYSINEVFEMFKKRFGCEKIHLMEQKGNYRETLRESDDALKLLRWSPQDRLENYINSL